MKLHLPKMLLTAVLAACVANTTAWGTISINTSTNVATDGLWSKTFTTAETEYVTQNETKIKASSDKDYVVAASAGQFFVQTWKNEGCSANVIISGDIYAGRENALRMGMDNYDVSLTNIFLTNHASIYENTNNQNHTVNITGTVTDKVPTDEEGVTVDTQSTFTINGGKYIINGTAAKKAVIDTYGLKLDKGNITFGKDSTLILGSTLINNKDATLTFNGTFEVKDISNYEGFSAANGASYTANGLYDDTLTFTVVKGSGSVTGLTEVIYKGKAYQINASKQVSVAGKVCAVVEEGKTVTIKTAEAEYYVVKAGTLSVSEGVLNTNALAYSGGSLELAAEATLRVLNNSDSSKNILSNTKGNGAVELNYSTTYDDVPKLGSDFTGTTYVKQGNFTINGASFGNKLVLGDGVNFQITNNASIEWSADKELVLNGTTQVHQNGSANLTYNGSVSGRTYDRRGGGTLIFNGAVDLWGLIVDAGGTTQLKNGGSIDTLSIKNSNTAVQFSSDGKSETTLYKVGTIGTVGQDGFARNITIDKGVKVSGTAFNNNWGFGTFTVNGELALTGDFKMWSGNTLDNVDNNKNNVAGTNKVTGSGSITAKTLVTGNPGDHYTLDVAEFSAEATTLGGKGITVTSGKVSLGALTLNAKLAVSGGTVGITSTTGSNTIEAKGGAINFQKGTHNLGTIDASAATADTELTLKKGANLTASTNLKLAIANSTIKLEDTATLTRGNLKVTGTDNTNGSTITRVKEQNGGGDVYAISNNTYVISNAKVEIAAAANEETVSNRLNNVALTNTGSGQLKVGNGHNLFSEIHAKNGNIFIGGMNNATAAVQQGTLKAVSVGAEKTLGVHTNWYNETTIDTTADLATLNVTETVTLGAGAKLYANLAMVSSVQRNATTTILTLSGTGENAATIYGDFSLTKGSLTLAGDVLKAIMDIEEGGTLDILAIGGDFIVNGETISTALTADRTGFSFSEVFTNTGYDDYYLGYTLGEGGKSNTLYIGKNIPEPTTATLSLLALAALAARRRRK